MTLLRACHPVSSSTICKQRSVCHIWSELGSANRGKNETSGLDGDTTHFLMQQADDNLSFFWSASHLPGAAAFWQAPVFCGLSSARCTKESLEVCYLCLGLHLLVKREIHPIKPLVRHLWRAQNRKGSKCFFQISLDIICESPKA